MNSPPFTKTPKSQLIAEWPLTQKRYSTPKDKEVIVRL